MPTYLSSVLPRDRSLFFDDYFYVDHPACGKVSVFCLQQSSDLLGLKLDGDKSQVPAVVANVLGVALNTAAFAREQLCVEPKPLRVSNFVRMVDSVLERNCLPPSVAASLLGKFGFLCSSLFGSWVGSARGPPGRDNIQIPPSKRSPHYKDYR